MKISLSDTVRIDQWERAKGSHRADVRGGHERGAGQLSNPRRATPSLRHP